MPSRNSVALANLAAAALSLAGCAVARRRPAAPAAVQRALLISVDGMHGIDLALHVKDHPDSTLASLPGRGVTYTNDRPPAAARPLVAGTAFDRDRGISLLHGHRL